MKRFATLTLAMILAACTPTDNDVKTTSPLDKTAYELVQEERGIHNADSLYTDFGQSIVNNERTISCAGYECTGFTFKEYLLEHQYREH